MKKIGFLGCGKIGGAIFKDLQGNKNVEITFIQDPFLDKNVYTGIQVVDQVNEGLLSETDIVIECATATVLIDNMDKILKYSDMVVFSATAFSEGQVYDRAKELMAEYGHKVYFPHGAILGIDGIRGGQSIIESVSITTTKNPKSLGREDAKRTIIYEGNTQGACKAFPRNVNVHAEVALAGIGFEKTQSTIVSDPEVNTNSHLIKVHGKGIEFEIYVSSFSEGGVTGKYTPYSAVDSIHKIIDDNAGFYFV